MKRTMALLLVLLLTLSCCPVTALAGDNVIDGDMGIEDSIFGVIDQGSCGDGLKWTFYDDGMLYISGEGAMEDYDPLNIPWYDYRADITQLVLGKNVVSIGDYAFYECTALTGELTLPAGLTGIGEHAFAGCTGLTGALVIPDGVTELPMGAFSGASGITSIVFGEAMGSIYADDNTLHALYGMEAVEEITFMGWNVPDIFDDPFE